MWPAQRADGVRGNIRTSTGVCALVSSLLIAGSPDAHAYVLVQTDAGTPIHWEDPCLNWWVHDSGSEDISRESLESTIGAAMETWSAVEGTSLNLQLNGATCLERHGGDGWPGPHNIIVWRDARGTWDYSSKMIAVTSVTYDTETAVIVDADIEMNGEDYRFGTTGAVDEVDLHQALLHELGHAVGLGHSSDTEAVMHAKGEPGDSRKPDLTADDRAGVVDNHPTRSPPGTCENLVGSDDNETYCPQEPESAGCATAARPQQGGLGLVLVLLGLALMRFQRRRRHTLMLFALAPLLVITTSAQAGGIYKTPGGVPLHWVDEEVPLVLDPDVPEEVADELLQTFEQAVKSWNDLDCVSTSLVIEGVESCPGEIVDDGVNCVVWVDKPELWRWPSHLVGITLVHFQGDTGRIIDTDMEFNEAFSAWSTAAECTDEAHDLWATVTHEVGHLLGLDHSGNPQATMNAVTFPGDCKKRTLHEDDEETVCALYEGIPYEPDTSVAPSDTGGSSTSDTGQGGGPSDGGGGNIGGCNGAAPGNSRLAALLIGVGWLARPRRRRRPSPFPAR